MEGLIGNIEDVWKLNYDNLVLKEAIGSGAFGAVLKGTYLGAEVAIKKIAEIQEDELIFIEREINLLSALRHPNIVQFIGMCLSQEGILHIVTEFIKTGDLWKRLKNSSINIPWYIRISLAHDIAAAMAYLHSHQIIHRDLKAKNILVDSNWRAKVCDFGLARTSQVAIGEREAMTLCGTEDW